VKKLKQLLSKECGYAERLRVSERVSEKLEVLREEGIKTVIYRGHRGKREKGIQAYDK
jgi:hypothetical protein